MKKSLFVVVLLAGLFGHQPASAQTGAEAPSLAAYDQFMESFLARWQIPGGALAVSRNGQLVYARGFGVADREAGEAVRPESLFRIASVSKPITGVAAMKLVQDGRLDLDARVFDLLPEYLPNPRPSGFDSRLTTITVRQLLHHTAGWDSSATGFDPMFQVVEAARVTGEAAPGACGTVIRYMLRSYPLSSAPGTRFAYSNLGYCILGRVIEKTSGMTYERFVQEEVLRPMGVDRMRLGRTRLEDRAAGEVKYYDLAAPVPSVFPTGPRVVPRPYGMFHLEAMDAHGGWLASVVDLAKFADSIDGRRGAGLLNKTTIAEMLARPPAPVSQAGGSWYGKGWGVLAFGGARDRWEHNGGIAGTMALVVRAESGLTWAAVFNLRPTDEGRAADELASGLWSALQNVREWPAHDLYPEFATEGSRPRLAGTLPVTNSASLEPGIVSGSWFSVRGARLATGSRSWRPEDFLGDRLPTSLDGVQVLVNGKPAALYSISEGQVIAQAPELPTGRVWVQVLRNGESSEPVAAEVRSASPGIFMYEAGGQMFAVAVHEDGAIAGNPGKAPGSRAVAPGGRIRLFATGLAPSPAGRKIAAPVVVEEPLEVRVGGQAAVLESAALVGPGVFQIQLVVSDSLPAGDHEVIVVSGGRESRRGVGLVVRL